MQVAQSDRRRQQNDKKSTNETISIITEWKDLNKLTPNTQREKEKKRKTNKKKKSHLELTNSSKVYFEKVSMDPSMYFRVNFFHISLLASLSVLGHLSCSFSKSFPSHLLFDKRWVWQVNCFQLSGSMWWCFKPFNLISD